MSLNWDSWEGKPSKKSEGFWDKATKLFTGKEYEDKYFSKLMRYILQVAINFSTEHFKDSGIYRDALVKKIFKSHMYQLSDYPKQRNMSKSKAYGSINRAIDKLIRKRYLVQKKTQDGRAYILATAMANKWFQRKIRGE